MTILFYVSCAVAFIAIVPTLIAVLVAVLSSNVSYVMPDQERPLWRAWFSK